MEKIIETKTITPCRKCAKLIEVIHPRKYKNRGRQCVKCRPIADGPSKLMLFHGKSCIYEPCPFYKHQSMGYVQRMLISPIHWDKKETDVK